MTALVTRSRPSLRALVLLGIMAAACNRSDSGTPAPHSGAAPGPVADSRGVVDPRRIAFHPSDPNRLLVVELGGGVAVWGVGDPQRPAKLWSVTANAVDAQFSRHGASIVTGGRDGHVRLWSGKGQQVWKSDALHQGSVRAVATGPDLIASAGEDGIRLWTLDGHAAGTLGGHDGTVLSVAFSPRGDRLAAEGIDTRLRLWPRDGTTPVFGAALVFREPNARYRAMLPNLIKWDVEWGWDRSVAFSPAGNVLAATGLDGSVQLWNLDGTPRGGPMFGHHGHHTRSVAFSPDGALMATGGFDGRVQLWNLDGSLHGDPLDGHVKSVLSVAFAPDGRRLASASLDGTVRLRALDGPAVTLLPKGN